MVQKKKKEKKKKKNFKLNLLEAVFVPRDFEVPSLRGGRAASFMETEKSSRSERKYQQLSLARFIVSFVLKRAYQRSESRKPPNKFQGH